MTLQILDGPTTPEAGLLREPVCALVVVEADLGEMGPTIEALTAGPRRPDSVVLVESRPVGEALADPESPTAAVADILRSRGIQDVRTLAVAPSGRSATSTLTLAAHAAAAGAPGPIGLAGGATPPDAVIQWLWLLGPGTRPEAATLDRLLAATADFGAVGIVGPKLLQEGSPRTFVELGRQVTRTGLPVARPAYGDPDQGQFDDRRDVLAVAAPGMLVRAGLFAELGGFDDRFDDYGAELDLCWRARETGWRVVVAPGAVVRLATAEGPIERGAADPRGRDHNRRSARQVALAHVHFVARPFVALWVALSSVVAGLCLLLVKRPGLAWARLVDAAVILWPRRSAFRRRGRRRDRHTVGALFTTPTTANKRIVEAIADAVTLHRARLDTPDAGDALESGPVADESVSLHVAPRSLAHRMATHPGVLAVLAAALVSAVAWREALTQGILSATTTGLGGGELRSVSTDASGLWHAFSDAWHGAGLGNSVDPGPYLAIVAGATWITEHLPYVGSGRSPVAATIGWLLLLAAPAATATAYLAGRVVTRASWPRALVALAWGTSGVLVGALAQGRLTVTLAHILIPLVFAGFALTVSSRGTFTAACATALAGAALAALVPATLPILIAAALIATAVTRGARLRALMVAVGPIALLGPWVLRFVDDWRLVLSGPGLMSTDRATAPPWQMVLGQPESTGGRFVWLTAPVVALAVFAVARHSGSLRRIVALLGCATLALVGLAAGLAAPRVFLGSATTGPGTSAVATVWPGVGLQLYYAALLAMVLTGSVGMGSWLRPTSSRGRRSTAVLAVGVLGLAVSTSAVLAARRGLGELVDVGRDTMPAVAVDQSTGPAATRLLLVSPGSFVVDYQLVGQEPGELLRDLDRTDQVTDPGVRSAVALLMAGSPTGSYAVHDALTAQAVGFVAVPSSATAVTRVLDATPGLTRLGAPDGRILWRVDPIPGAQGPIGPSRARIVDAAGSVLTTVPTDGPHGAARDEVAAGPAGRRLVVAEPPEWAAHATVTYAGRVLSAASGGGQPAYALPTTAGTLTIELAPEHARWRRLQGVLVALVAFLAIPFGTRRSRRTR